MSEPRSQPQRVDVQQRLAALLADELGSLLLARATPAQLAAVAGDVMCRDLFDLPTFLSASVGGLGLTDDPPALVERHLEHLLWVQHRRAWWAGGAARSAAGVGLDLRVEGGEHVAATEGEPTVLLSPMTLCHEDALWISSTVSPRRELAVYGEDVETADLTAALAGVVPLDTLHVVDGGQDAAVDILRSLRRGGCLLTYPDFVYAGHRVEPSRVLGIEWPLSAAFVALCARPGTLLLPARLAREGERGVVARFGTPIRVEAPGEGADRSLLRRLVAGTVGAVLTRQILAAPEQWLLLSTITAECRQRAW